MHDTGNTSAAIEIVPYMAAHFMVLVEQDKEKIWGGMVRTPGYARQLEKAGPAHTIMRGDKVLGCAGIIEQWSNRAIAWAIMTPKIGSDFIHVHKATLRFLNIIGYRRIEMTVADGFESGRRWAEMLGFKCETPEGMKGYGPEGSNHFLYARVVK